MTRAIDTDQRTIHLTLLSVVTRLCIRGIRNCSEKRVQRKIGGERKIEGITTIAFGIVDERRIPIETRRTEASIGKTEETGLRIAENTRTGLSVVLIDF